MEINQLVEHHSIKVQGLTWHWVEMGAGDPVILLHGIPESWYCWHRQIPILASQFRVLAIDLKGYGSSDKSDGDYTTANVAREIVQLLDVLEIDRFRLAGHDWGTAVADRICTQIPERVVQYVRASLAVHEYDVRNSLHHYRLHENPEAGSRLLKKADAYVRVWFDSSCTPDTRPSETELARIIAEFDKPGVAEAVVRYFRDADKNPPMDFPKLTMPVLYVHGEHDPRQPIKYIEGLENHIPGLEAVLLLDCGHFVTHERPEEVAKAMLWFYNSMLAPGVPLFTRSRDYSLPTRPKQPIDFSFVYGSQNNE